MPKENLKLKTTKQESKALPKMEIERRLKHQQNILQRLQNELKSANSEVQLSHCETTNRDKCIFELEHSINQCDAEVKKLRINLDNFKENNSNILLELNYFKEKYYQLEANYQEALKQQKQEKEKASLKREELQEKLQDKINNFSQLNIQYKEALKNFNQTKMDFEQQQKEMQLFIIEVNQDKKLIDEKNKINFNNLQDELRQKNAIIKKCFADTNLLEKEKNAVIVELNHKIQRIETAFSQPAKALQGIQTDFSQLKKDAQPMMTLPRKVNNLDNNSNSESSSDNFTYFESHLRSLSAKENQQASQNQTPIQPITSSQQSNKTKNKKQKNQPTKNSSAKKTWKKFAASSSGQDDDDDSNDNYSQPFWQPNNNCYDPDTDASEGFANSKFSKN